MGSMHREAVNKDCKRVGFCPWKREHKVRTMREDLFIGPRQFITDSMRVCRCNNQRGGALFGCFSADDACTCFEVGAPFSWLIVFYTTASCLSQAIRLSL